MKKRGSLSDLRTLVCMGMLTGLAYGVMAVCKPIPKVDGFLSLDAIDAVIGVGGFLFGPVAAVMMILVEALLEMVTLSTTGWYGFVMNVASTTLLICPAVLIYRRWSKTAGAAVGLGVGVLCRLAGMIVLNYFVTPFYFGMPRAEVVPMLPMIAVFNLVKGVLNASLLMVLYPPVTAALRKAGLISANDGSPAGEKRGFNYVPWVLSALVLAGAVVAFCFMAGVFSPG